MTGTTEASGEMRRLDALAATDTALRAKLLEHGASALAELEVTVRREVTVKIVEDTSTVTHRVLPVMPTEELVGVQLDQVAGGGIVDDATGRGVPKMSDYNSDVSTRMTMHQLREVLSDISKR